MLFSSCSSINTVQTDVLVIGGSTSGTSAAIQSARLGATTLLVEESNWLGGMISSAGVSAFDGNHNIPSGIWDEFRQKLYKHYGGAEKVATGWVSNTLFEPHVADSIFKSMTDSIFQLKVLMGWTFSKTILEDGKVKGALFFNMMTGDQMKVASKVVIDGTELGDALADAGVKYDVGLEPEVAAFERINVGTEKGIIQDLTYVAVLKDFGPSADCTIVRPSNYRPEEFDGACSDYYFDTTRKKPSVDAKKMLDYGRLPNQKFMINWPIYGNDYYFNPITLGKEARDSGYKKAKEQTLRFVYFIQHQLGFKNLGLADDEFPTNDRLALIPYHRESRRIRGLVRYDMLHLATPFDQESPMYRTGIAVGDYPVDHHHKKNVLAPQQLDFYPVPSFNIPLGTLIPNSVDGIIAAEKSISVSNVINGATRLQPCVMLIGQAAGTLAALAVKENIAIKEVPVRKVQSELLKNKAMIMPYIDVTPSHPNFESIQRIGATGILRGKGIPYKWANQTWFYPDYFVSVDTLNKDASGWLTMVKEKEPFLTVEGARMLIAENASLYYDIEISNSKKRFDSVWSACKLPIKEQKQFITRAELSVMIDKIIQPFEKKPINHFGILKSQ
jgi:hypothetical protein